MTSLPAPAPARTPPASEVPWYEDPAHMYSPPGEPDPGCPPVDRDPLPCPACGGDVYLHLGGRQLAAFADGYGAGRTAGHAQALVHEPVSACGVPRCGILGVHEHTIYGGGGTENGDPR